jgi:outer membrane protein assembly factor BamD
MLKISRILFISFSFFMVSSHLSSCAKTASLPDNATPQEMYDAAVLDMEDGLYPEAIKVFETIRMKYPYSAFASLSDLRIADCHLLAGRYLEAIEGFRRFLQLHPKHAQAPYAMFKIGESHMKRAPKDWWFMPPAYEKDLSAVRQGVAVLNDFLKTYAEHALSEDVKKLLLQGRTRLGEHELYVAEFYHKRESWKAAASRADIVINGYQGTQLEPRAFYIAIHSYIELENKAAARARALLFEERFPNHELLGETQFLMKEAGLLDTVLKNQTDSKLDSGEENNG